MNRFHRAALACASALVLPGLAHAGDPALSGGLMLTSDYLFRGVSQTLGGPALQAALRYDTASGFYAAGSASNVDYGPGSDVRHEFDAVVGVARSFGAVALDLSHARYVYPGADPAGSLDYSEWLLVAGLGERWTASAGWSGDVFAGGRTGTHAQLAYRHPLGTQWALHGAVGNYRLPAGLRDYHHAEAGATWTRGRWEARVTLHGASSAARANFGDAAPRRRVEAAVTVSF
jgi:uncharacterized protein (TIGR02001 family)